MDILLQILPPVVTHLWFKNYEPTSLKSILTVLGTAPLLQVVTKILNDRNATDSPPPFWSSITSGYVFFYTILLLSVSLYRISPFHPLSKYPGPLMCKLTKLTGMSIAIRGDTHLFHKNLHDRYGPIVRVGPNELSVVEKDLIPFILGNQGMPRGPLWDGRRFNQVDYGKPYDTLIDVRDSKIHAELRKPWNQAFSAGPVKDYQDLLVTRGKQLQLQLELLCSQGHSVAKVDLAKWLSFFSFDFMGDLAFGGCFELMKDGDVHGFWKSMEAGMLLPSITQHVPWLASALRMLPFIGSDMRSFGEFGVQQALRRISMETKKKDLFHHLYEVTAESTSSLEAQLPLAVSNTILTIVAGSDTTASVLSSTMSYLICHPEIFERLRKEIDVAFPGKGDDTNDKLEDRIETLAGLTYLNAVVNEGLRLLPAVPTNIQRAPERGSGGKMLGDGKTFISEGTAINIPPYTLHRDPRYFSPSPNNFIPERWLSTPTSHMMFNTQRDAFIPFSYGPANCAGKPLALIELRYIIAMLVQQFDICFQAFEDAAQDTLVSHEEMWESRMKDHFVFSKGELNVEIRLRSW